MAAIHDLLAQVQDTALRERIEKEIKKLAKTKNSGWFMKTICQNAHCFMIYLLLKDRLFQRKVVQ